MLCDICHKNEATMHFKYESNDNVVQVNVCEGCAGEKGMDFFSLEAIPMGGKQFSLADLLAGITENHRDGETRVHGEKCPNCGLTYEDFRKMGRLGCSECYAVFRNKLLPLLKRIQGATCHSGKSPLKRPGSTEKGGVVELTGLKNELKKAVGDEEYEKAAVIRDRIRELEKKGKAK